MTLPLLLQTRFTAKPDRLIGPMAYYLISLAQLLYVPYMTVYTTRKVVYHTPRVYLTPG